MATRESKIEEFDEDLRALLGTARAKAQGWLGQRRQIAKTLEGVRDTASSLLADLGHELGSGRKRRTMSASARAKISAAQKARWARQKAGEG
jgi:hypothetical protein